MKSAIKIFQMAAAADLTYLHGRKYFRRDMKAWKHFCTITHHKILVMKGCFKIGLYRQGLLHDMSKYSPTEFLVGCRYYQRTKSPNNTEREAKGYSSAWLHPQ